MNRRTVFASAVVILINASGGCAESHRVDVMTVLSNANCQTSEVGVRSIDYAALATFRGTHLIGMTESEDAVQRPVHLIAIVPGEFPTPGYSVALQGNATFAAGRLNIKVKIDRPPPDAMLAQMTTHPCLVVGIADPAVQHVRVEDDSATLVGEVDLLSAKQP
jgi:hypothetical protein